MSKMLIERSTVEQVLDVLSCLEYGFCGITDGPSEYATEYAITALEAALAEPVLQTCNCRWDGETQVQQCTLHEAHVDAIHEWAERAKTAEKKLAAVKEPVQEPVAYIHRQGRHWEVSERPLADDEKARGWTEEPLFTVPPQRKPLSEEEIHALRLSIPATTQWLDALVLYTRAVERAHGIGGEG